MKLDDSNTSAITPTNSSANLPLSKQAFTESTQRLCRQSSTASSIQRRNQYLVHQRRQNAKAASDFTKQNSLSKPLVTGAIDTFFQTTKIMEDEIMLPSKLKDIPVEEIVLDCSVQPENWHELYTFVRDIRNQLACSRPFVDEDDAINQEQTNDSNEDEGILLAGTDNNNNTIHSSASSTVSLDELERSTSSSVVASLGTIKDELKNHYYGLIASLDSLTSMANRVTEKYREDSVFKP